MEQLAERNKTYPIKYDMDPLGDNDPNVPWLAPGRLLIFAKYKPLLNDTFNATGTSHVHAGFQFNREVLDGRCCISPSRNVGPRTAIP